jgi:hypothetical protein
VYKRTNIDPKITKNAHTIVILGYFIFDVYGITIITIYYYCGGGGGGGGGGVG